jgi:hypothetical protein
MTEVKADEARHLMNTLAEWAGNRDLIDALTVAAPLPRTGHPPKAVDGTQESRALQELAHANPKHRLNELGIPLARSTIERIVYMHNNVLFRENTNNTNLYWMQEAKRSDNGFDVPG